jgi:integral membrane sensor domain MASE1
MTFEAHIVAFCDRFLAQRTFDLIVAPALADCAFEESGGRRSRLATRAAVVRAVAGGVLHDAQRGSDVFFKILLLSMSYFMFPVMLSMTAFKTWSAFLIFATIVVVMSTAPVIICFWPERRSMRLGE